MRLVPDRPSLGPLLAVLGLALVLAWTLQPTASPVREPALAQNPSATLPLGSVPSPALARSTGPPPLVPARFLSARERPSASVVDPYTFYAAQPAPMGIADFGVGVNDAAYRYNSSEFLANFSWQSLSFRGSSGTQFTVQLNVVLVFATNTTAYVYWVQDVAWFDSASLTLSFEDNIWNFSTVSGCLSSSAVSGNGSVWPYRQPSCQGYYAASSTDQPGADRTMPTPGNFSLLLRSYRDASGAPGVAFEYWDGASRSFVTFDNVVWPWATKIASDENFVVDGTQYAPSGGFYDAEATIGGPGGGLSTQAQDLTRTELRLLEWNGHNFQAPRATWNFGSDTGETVGELQSVWSPAAVADANGTPLLVQANGTAQGTGLDQAYNQSSVGYLNLSAAAVGNGTVVVGTTGWPFVGGAANITLTPGSYTVWLNSTAGADDLGQCTIAAGATTAVNASIGCSPTASEPTASSVDLDVGQSTTVRTDLLSPGSGNDTFSWRVTPNGLGCVARTNVSLECTPTSTGIYALVVTVTDSEGQSMSTSALVVVVNSDPTVSLTVSHPDLDIGQETVLQAAASGGTGSYSYTWSSLPGGCTAAPVATVSCAPTTGGSSYVEVAMTDSAGWVASVQQLVTVYSDPSIAGIVVTPNPVVEGSTAQLAVTVSGGRAPMNFTYVGLPSGCSSEDLAVLNCTPHHLGTYSVQVVVTDADGYRSNSTATFTVDAEVLGLPLGEGYLLLDGTILGTAVAIAAAVVVARGRLSRSKGPTGTAPRHGPRPSSTSPWSAVPPLCHHCGTVPPPGSLYCGACGRVLDDRRRS